MGTAASGLAAAGATVSLDTAAGASFAPSAGAAGTAAVTAIRGMGSAGAAASVVFGGVTATAALPAVAGAGAALGAGILDGKGSSGFAKRSKAARSAAGSSPRPAPCSCSTWPSKSGSFDAAVVDPVLRGRAKFTSDQLETIRGASTPSPATRWRHRTQPLGCVARLLPQRLDPRGQPLTRIRFDELISVGLITMQTD